MERVLFLSPRRPLEEDISGWDRIYVGSEFCERLIPEEDDIRRIIEARGDFTAASLVTPYVTDSGLRRVMGFVEKFVSVDHVFDEVIVNDWGVLRRLRALGSKRVLGRLLIRQLRDPRVLRWKEKMPDRLVAIDELSVNETFIEFLESEGIERIELDTIPADLRLLQGRVKLSLYEPFTYVTTTRLCPMANLATRDRFILYVPKACSYECVGRVFVLKNKVMGRELYLFGNTIFFRNEKAERVKESSVFDRIVHQQLP